MSPTDIQEFLAEQKVVVENHLEEYISSLTVPTVLKEAMGYSLRAGGKRIRPLLVLATIHAFGKDEKIGIPVACAIEMIHTYSLIHDDLPSMDDDDLRRGMATNHKVYGEANAILAGDGLLTYSFQVISEMNNDIVPLEAKLTLIAELAKAAGPEGMVGGQVSDIEGEGVTLTLADLESIHTLKTGRLLTYSVLAGGILSDASKKQLETLESFATHLGLAFQIRDDILDIVGDQETIGKPIGSDSANEKNTYPSLLTLDGAQEKLAYHLKEAKTALKNAEIKIDILDYLCDLVAYRQN